MKFPIWAWICDRCGADGGDYEPSPSDLPSDTGMRRDGWFITNTAAGDMCPECYETVQEARGE